MALSFTQANQDLLEQSGRKVVHRAEFSFPGYSCIIIHDPANWATGSLRVTSESGNVDLTTTEVPLPVSSDNAQVLASDLADYINSNLSEIRAVWEAVGADAAVSGTQARLILLGTRQYPTTGLTPGGAPVWATAVTTPSTGWDYNVISGDEPISGYSPVLHSIDGFGQKLDPISRAVSVDDIEVKIGDDDTWKKAIQWFGGRNTPCTFHFGVWDGSHRSGPGSAINWQQYATYWVQQSKYATNSEISVFLYGVEGFLSEKKIQIPHFHGRHPLQAMRIVLNAAGFVDGVDARIAWSSFDPSVNPERGHFCLSFFRDWYHGLNAEEEEREEHNVWDLLSELALLQGGTLRPNVNGLLSYHPYDRDTAAVEIWDFDAETGFDGDTLETEELEGLVTNRVLWEFSNSSGSADWLRQPVSLDRSSKFALEAADSVQLYDETYDVSFESRWLNAVSQGRVPFGALGSYWANGTVFGPTEQRRTIYALGNRTGQQRGAQVYSTESQTFWHSDMPFPQNSGGTIVDSGSEGIGKDEGLILPSAAITGFCGTRSSGVSNSNYFPTSASTNITFEDAVANLDAPSGREAYIQFDAPTSAVRPADWVTNVGTPYPPTNPIRKAPYTFIYHDDASSADGALPDDPRPEVIKVLSYVYNNGAAIPFSYPGALAWVSRGAQKYFYPNGNHVPANLVMNLDLTYNSEGFTDGRAGFGTLPPRRDYTDDLTQVDGRADGGWTLVNQNGKAEARICDVTIQTYRSRDILDRFKYGVWQLRARTPISKMRFQIGDVVSLVSSRFFSFGRSGLDATATFEITEKRIAQGGKTVEWQFTLLKDSGQPNIPGQISYPTTPTFPGPRPPGGGAGDVVTDNSLVDVYSDWDGDGTEDEVVTT